MRLLGGFGCAWANNSLECVPMKLILAPMEGLADFHVRQALTDIGGFDWCVTEFVRVNGTLLPPRTFYRWCPELLTGARTRAGTPVHVQLLGSDPHSMAANAMRAAELGAPAIDLNFGCPAKTVNRHRGGAVLLDEPQLVHDIVAAVRAAVPTDIPVSVKMRLGNCDGERASENALAIQQAGAAWLTVHGRTRVQGYRPPAYWDRIGLLQQQLDIPVIANGEIWTCEDAQRCVQESGCDWLMLGRGAVSDPFLSQRIIYDSNAGWDEISACLLKFIDDCRPISNDQQLVGRVKQWMNYLRRDWTQAQCLYDLVKRSRESEQIATLLRQPLGLVA